MIVLFLILFIIALLGYKRYGIEGVLLTFSSSFLISGDTIISGLIAIITLLTLCIYKYKLDNKTYLIISLIIILIFSINIYANKLDNLYQSIQIVVLLFIFIQTYRNFNTYYKHVYRGVLLGSIFIIINTLYLSIIKDDLVQGELVIFTISKTFNYTSLYILLGTIIAPRILELSLKYKIILYILGGATVFILHSRGVFFITLLMFPYVIEFNKIYKKLLIVPIIYIVISLLINLNLVSRDNPNDILFSIFNIDVNTSNIERLDMFGTVLSNLNKYPLGWGTDNSVIALNEYGFLYAHSHNTLSQMVIEYGYIGILFYSIFIILLIKLVNHSSIDRRHNAFVVMLIILITTFEAIQYNLNLTLITIYLIGSTNFLNVRFTSKIKDI